MSELGEELIHAMEEAIAYARGDNTSLIVHPPKIRETRKNLGLTQEQMAFYLGTSVSGYRKWEQGERVPSGAAKNLLRVMQKNPKAVMEALR